MNNVVLAILANHLWQSTLVAAAFGGLALLLRANSARVRYALWLAASMKFLVPFAAVAALGTLIPWQQGERRDVTPRILSVAGDIAAPVNLEIPFPDLREARVAREAGATGEISAAGDRGSVASLSRYEITIIGIIATLAIWLIGSLAVTARWLLRWRAIRRVLRASTALEGIDFPVPIRTTESQMEPGVVGIFRPALLLPAGIQERLTADQMRAVLAHERCHLQRRDNLTACLHMLVECVFWFFPPVWWIGARLIEERERACDEQVIREGHKPDKYAEGILQVCEHYIASRLPCVSGVSGADLRKRVESILRSTLGANLDGRKKLALAAVIACTIAAPIAAGMISGNAWQVGLSTYVSALNGYRNVASAQVDDLTNNSRWALAGTMTSCPPPTRKLVEEQKKLAAIVARLSAGDGEKAVLFAVAANSAADVQRLLEAGASPGVRDLLGDGSLMHAAARFADVDVFEALAEAGVPIDEWQSSLGDGPTGVTAQTPLHVAIPSGPRHRAEWFVARGADVNATNPKSGQSPLVLAMAMCRDKELVDTLLKAGARPDFKALRIADELGFDLRTAPSMAPSTAPSTVRRAESSASAPPFQSWHPAAHDAQISLDIDGDGAPDQATLRLSLDGKQEALFVSLGRDPARWIRAAETRHREPADAAQMKISPYAQGTYVTRCGKGLGLCGSDDPKAVNLHHEGILFFQPESAASIVYWDDAARRLKQVWISD